MFSVCIVHNDYELNPRSHTHPSKEREKNVSSHALTGNAGIIWTKRVKTINRDKSLHLLDSQVQHTHYLEHLRSSISITFPRNFGTMSKDSVKSWKSYWKLKNASIMHWWREHSTDRIHFWLVYVDVFRIFLAGICDWNRS